MIVLIGASASGKTEIAKKLIKTHGYHRLITYTTRPKRAGEENDVDYHFVDKTTFSLLKYNNHFLETSCYNDEYYGSPKSGATKNAIIIVDPKGANAIHSHNIPNTILFFLQTDEDVRKIRMMQRGDSIDMIQKRIIGDKDVFAMQAFDHIDHIINTTHKSIVELSNQIHSIYKNELQNRTI